MALHSPAAVGAVAAAADAPLPGNLKRATFALG